MSHKSKRSRARLTTLGLMASLVAAGVATPASAQGFGCRAEEPPFEIGVITTGSARVVGLAFVFGDRELTLTGEDQDMIDDMVRMAEWRTDGIRLDLDDPDGSGRLLTLRADQVWIDPGDREFGAATVGLARIGTGPAFPVTCSGDYQGEALSDWRDRIRGP